MDPSSDADVSGPSVPPSSPLTPVASSSSTTTSTSTATETASVPGMFLL